MTPNENDAALPAELGLVVEPTFEPAVEAGLLALVVEEVVELARVETSLF